MFSFLVPFSIQMCLWVAVSHVPLLFLLTTIHFPFLQFTFSTFFSLFFTTLFSESLQFSFRVGYHHAVGCIFYIVKTVSTSEQTTVIYTVNRLKWFTQPTLTCTKQYFTNAAWSQGLGLCVFWLAGLFCDVSIYVGQYRILYAAQWKSKLLLNSSNGQSV